MMATFDMLVLHALGFGGVALLSWLAVGRLQGWLIHRALIDKPNDRSLHDGHIPRGGGLVIVVVLIAVLLVMALSSDRPQSFLALGTLSLCWAGLAWRDDQFNLSPGVRFLFQCVFAVLTVFLFGHITQIELSANYVISLGGLGGLLSVLGILWFTNLYNFMDGMDGLAGSQTIIAAVTLGFWSQSFGDWHLAVCCGVLAAASYGFLIHNWNPASVFMGDVGSITIGAFFAAIIIYMHTRYGIPVLCFVLLFSVFVADATVTLIRRLIKGEKVWLPHRSHFYQRLGVLEISHAGIVIAYILLMIVCSVVASLAVSEHDRILMLGGFTAGIMTVAAVGVALIEISAKAK